ncbi:MAG TPA: NAD(P)/FAD-dependent oxidoreductase [Candidatus Kapabacteria bacterium]|nr:NAD(P)/FAD-dependent oxidoreductase [Candidatus Kapabacteria bacterium]
MNVDVIVIGAGAAGLMCAIEAGKRGRSVLILERNKDIGEKIRISGGGRCNFTNVIAEHESYLSQNEHFCKSALARFTPQDFIELVSKHGIAYHEKKLGQLFCDDRSREIIEMLLEECKAAGVKIRTGVLVQRIIKGELFVVDTEEETLQSASLVIATGGLSVPKIGATAFGYEIAKQFGLNIVPCKPGLVPFVLSEKDNEKFSSLAGVSIDAVVSCNKTHFRENILFTHKGLSGPAILQISSYWNPGDVVTIDLLPEVDILKILMGKRQEKIGVVNILVEYLPKRFVQKWCEINELTQPLSTLSNKKIELIAHRLHHWEIVPAGTEGYEKAEVTVGGVDTNELSSKTMEAKEVPGLYFIGEVVDVTGWLGGYNFQWAWASGFVAGQYA